MAREGLFRRQIRVTFPKIGLSFYSTDITDLRQEFVVPFGTNIGSVIGEHKMWNLTAATASKLARKDPIILEAGYRGVGWGEPNEPKLVLAGEIVQVYSQWAGPDKITTIEIGDAHSGWLSRRVNRDWLPGTKVRQVVRDLCADSGLPEGKVLVRGADNFTFEDGYATAANDTVKSALDRIAGELLTVANAVYEVHVAQGRINFHHESDLWEHSGVLLSAETGLLGQVEIVRRDEPDDPDPTAEPQKYTARALLTPELWADKAVDIKARITGGTPDTFKIVEGQHVGTMEGDFITDLVLQQAGATDSAGIEGASAAGGGEDMDAMLDGMEGEMGDGEEM